MERKKKGLENIMPSFEARPIKTIKRGKGVSDSLEIGVFQKDAEDSEKLIGTYARNYSSFFNTFFHFKVGDTHYALYSPRYTVTRVMRITPDVGFEDIGGEEDTDGRGFCPVDLYVPTIQIWQKDESGQEPYVYHPRHGTFGFVAGCYWGDDLSWKIQYLDLSRISEGIIKRDERFGYITLPASLSLAEAIYIDADELNHPDPIIHIDISQDFNLNTGERED